MKKVILFGLMPLLLLAGCGPSEPSNREVAAGAREVLYKDLGLPRDVNVRPRVERIGNGRWHVEMDLWRYGQRRKLNATAIMDKNGDLHYYTD